MVAFSLARSVSSARTRPCTSSSTKRSASWTAWRGSSTKPAWMSRKRARTAPASIEPSRALGSPGAATGAGPEPGTSISVSVPGGLWPARSDSGLSTPVDTAAGVSSVGVPVAGVAASGFAVPAVSKIEVPAPPAGGGAGWPARRLAPRWPGPRRPCARAARARSAGAPRRPPAARCDGPRHPRARPRCRPDPARRSRSGRTPRRPPRRRTPSSRTWRRPAPRRRPALRRPRARSPRPLSGSPPGGCGRPAGPRPPPRRYAHPGRRRHAGRSSTPGARTWIHALRARRHSRSGSVRSSRLLRGAPLRRRRGRGRPPIVASLSVPCGDLVPRHGPVRGPGPVGLVHLEQVLEQGAVVDEGLAKVLGGRLRALVGLGDGVRRAVVVFHLCSVHRDVGRALPEILDRVAALAHDLVDQPVGAAGRLGRRVDEARLDHAPLLEVAVARAGLQRHDAQLLATRAAVVELMLGRLAAARVPDRSVVLRPELVAEPRGALPAEHQPCERERHDDDDGDEQAGIHWPLLSVPCLVFGGLASGLRRMRCRLSHSAIPVKGVPKPGTSPLPRRDARHRVGS